MDWEKVIFLHTGWCDRYDGTEAPTGGHAYLQGAVGVESENFKLVDGWCYGYAPVSRTGESRGLRKIPRAGRTLNITKLGASVSQSAISGITVVWTARRPGHGPVLVGLYDNATAYRFMPPLGEERPFIVKSRAEDCRLLPVADRKFTVVQKKKGFPGMAAAWFPGEHRNGPARTFLTEAAEYIQVIRSRAPVAAAS